MCVCSLKLSCFVWFISSFHKYQYMPAAICCEVSVFVVVVDFCCLYDGETGIAPDLEPVCKELKGRQTHLVFLTIESVRGISFRGVVVCVLD